MSTRGRRKLTGAAPVPGNQNADLSTNVVVGSKSVASGQRRAKAKVPVARRTKVVLTPVKKRALRRKKPTRVPKIGTEVVSDAESDSSQLLEDPELLAVVSGSEDEIQSKIDQLRKQLAKLETRQESRRQLKLKSPQFASGDGSHREPNAVNKRADPTGRSESRNVQWQNEPRYIFGPVRKMQSPFWLVGE